MKMIQINLFKNDSVTTEDINLAAKAFGPNVAKIKGKSTEQTWHKISVIWCKYQMNYWKLTRILLLDKSNKSHVGAAKEGSTAK